MDMEKVLAQATQAIIERDSTKGLELTKAALAEGVDPIRLMNEGFIPGIQKVGDLFGRGELFIPELIQAGNVMNAVIEIINQALPEQKGVANGTILIATVKGDVHDIGKSMVVSLLKANGFTVHDLGRDVSTDKIIQKALDFNAQVIGTSSLLTTTMPEQKKLEEALKKAGLRDRFKTIVGGAPVTARWAAKIGADAFAVDAQDGVVQIKRLLGLLK
ncbi:MAG: corrinoid protein [Deltaproteobacteria bacterium]|nr:corrinoid protein [Deltaproteobacteria bacterium]